MLSKLYDGVFNSLRDGIYFVDTERRITFWNKGAERLIIMYVSFPSINFQNFYISGAKHDICHMSLSPKIAFGCGFLGGFCPLDSHIVSSLHRLRPGQWRKLDSGHPWQWEDSRRFVRDNGPRHLPI